MNFSNQFLIMLIAVSDLWRPVNSLTRTHFMNHFHQCFDMIRRDFRKHAVSQIENVTWATGSGIEDSLGSCSQCGKVSH